jgi:hypothetical protein
LKHSRSKSISAASRFSFARSRKLSFIGRVFFVIESIGHFPLAKYRNAVWLSILKMKYFLVLGCFLVSKTMLKCFMDKNNEARSDIQRILFHSVLALKGKILCVYWASAYSNPLSSSPRKRKPEISPESPVAEVHILRYHFYF